MTIGVSMERGSTGIIFGPRFYFLLFLTSGIGFGQQDSSTVFRISGGTSYHDIYRQTSDRSRTVLFSKASTVTISAARTDDSLAVSYRSAVDYGSLSQYQSRFSGSFRYSLQDITIHYAGTASFLRYSILARIPIGISKDRPRLGATVSSAPFGSFLSASVSVLSKPASYVSGMTFHDFIVHVDDDVSGVGYSYTVGLTPVPSLSLSITYDESSGDRAAAPEGYGVWAQFHSLRKEISGMYLVTPDLAIDARASTSVHRMNLTMKRNDLTFGDVSNASSAHTRYSAGLHSVPVPITAEYVFEQGTMTGVGQIESWPFSSFAASIIANRVNFILNGTVKHHAFTVSSDAWTESPALTIRIAYHRLMTDAGLEHWEPEFLVFGRKNEAADPFSISSVHMAAVGFSYRLPFSAADVVIDAEQFIPLSIRYRIPATGTAPSPAPSDTPPSRSVTDGGRRAGIRFTIPL